MKKRQYLTLLMVVNLLLSVTPLSLAVTTETTQALTNVAEDASPEMDQTEESEPSTESPTDTTAPLPGVEDETDETTPSEEVPATLELTDEEKEGQSEEGEAFGADRAVAPEGEKTTVDQYVTITNKNYQLWQNFDWEVTLDPTDYFQQTFHVTEAYTHENGKTYLVLLTNTQKEIGIIDAQDVTEAPGQQGVPLKASDYVTVTGKNDTLWQNFDFEVLASASKLYQQTFHVKEYFNHHNGEKYVSLSDAKGKWQGYLNVKATTKAAGPQGVALKSTDYVTITSKNYNLWSNFSWKYRNKSATLYQQTFQAKVYYNHHSGAKYLSLYDAKGKWQGYINANATTKAAGQQGVALKSTDYVTITSKNYTLWSNFNWKYRSKSATLYQKTFQAKVYYNHHSGAKYLSLYDSKGKWQGYINAKATTKAPGPQGIWLKTAEEVILTKRNYPLWQNFKWEKRGSSNQYLNQRLDARGYYNHHNGEKYYSLYNQQGKWQGYVNAKGVKVVPGAAQFLGTTRKKIVDGLKAHANDRYYLGTPYRSLNPNPNPNRLLSPQGAPTNFGPGMNCTGFVAHGVRNGGGKLNAITNSANAWGGIANAYNWRDALKRNTKYETFNSVSELLKSGKAKQGDILYFEPDFSRPGYDCHIGFFWGNSPQQNKIWHSVARGNSMGNIGSGTPYTKIYLFPLE